MESRFYGVKFRTQIDVPVFKKHFRKLYNKLFIMEETKYLPPKFSYACKDIAKYFDVFERKFSMTALSVASSENSFVSIIKNSYLIIDQETL